MVCWVGGDGGGGGGACLLGSIYCGHVTLISYHIISTVGANYIIIIFIFRGESNLLNSLLTC